MDNVIIHRDSYLKQLIQGQQNGMIKIVTGIRRCGKSFLLFTLFRGYLLEHGVDEKHIISLSLDEYPNKYLLNPNALLEYINTHLQHDGQVNYVILDEVQLVEDFIGVLLTLMHMRNVDVYVSGSNSKFLSKDVVTEFRGRGDEIHVYPLSFAEYYSAVGGDKSACWNIYFRYGGLPQLLHYDDEVKKQNYLRQLVSTVYLRDVVERYNIKYEEEFVELLSVMASGIGAPCNPTKLANTFQSVKGVRLTKDTVANYLNYMQDAFLLEKAMRYDVKGKRYINTLSKYYFQDVGLRNAALDFRQWEETHIMENVIYNELRLRGYQVDVGLIEVRKENRRSQLEIDFVANRGYHRYYIQSTYDMPTPEKQQQESAPLLSINDGFKRVIITRYTAVPYYNPNGFLILGLLDFLLNDNVLETT